MLRKLVAFLLMLTLILTFGCKKDNPTEPVKNVEFETVAAVGDIYFSNYVTTSGAGVNIGIADLFTNLQDGNTANDPVILDYRSAADFATGRIRGAENITLAGLVDRVATLSKSKKIVNVCYTGQNSSFATAFLNLLGYDSQSLSFGMCGVSTTAGINGTDKWAAQIAADEFAAQLTATASTATATYTFPELSTGKTTAEDIMKERYKLVTGSWTISAADVFANPANYFIVNYWPLAEYTNPGHIRPPTLRQNALPAPHPALICPYFQGHAGRWFSRASAHCPLPHLSPTPFQKTQHRHAKENGVKACEPI